MIIGLVGLGLIGGSMAKAIKENTQHSILGYDIKLSEIYAAKLVGSIDGELDDDTIGTCDMIIVSIYPQGTIDYIKEKAEKFKKGAIVIDCGGTKAKVCEELYPVADRNGFEFIGGHPMAGTQFSSFRYSKATLFKGATMLLAPQESTSIHTRERARDLFLETGFGRVQFTTPQQHDRIIAYTSQLPHIISNAYVKSPNAQDQRGFSAGSYKDLSRVAKLNEPMWTELFLENRENIIYEIDTLIENLKQYSDAIKANDAQALIELLRDGTQKKEIADKRVIDNKR
ncbi:MAG TPA: prephenate dehydrogenase [Thermoclostridium sp.]|nr:prephenate dehydrogenase [Thermoclostridium sp.]